MCGEDEHVLIMTPSWNTYDTLMLIMVHYFEKWESAGTRDDKHRFKKLYNLYFQQANVILDVLQK